jgi:hypothetical protein
MAIGSSEMEREDGGKEVGLRMGLGKGSCGEARGLFGAGAGLGRIVRRSRFERVADE